MVLLSLFSLAVFGGCLGGGKSKIEAVGKVDHHEELKKIMDKMGRVTDRTLSSLGGKRLTEKEISYVGHMAAGTSLIFCEEGEKRKEMLANLALVKGQESNERKELEFVTPPTEEAVEKALKEIKNFTKSKVKDDEIRRFLKNYWRYIYQKFDESTGRLSVRTTNVFPFAVFAGDLVALEIALANLNSEISEEWRKLLVIPVAVNLGNIKSLDYLLDARNRSITSEEILKALSNIDKKVIDEKRFNMILEEIDKDLASSSKCGVRNKEIKSFGEMFQLCARTGSASIVSKENLDSKCKGLLENFTVEPLTCAVQCRISKAQAVMDAWKRCISENIKDEINRYIKKNNLDSKWNPDTWTVSLKVLSEHKTKDPQVIEENYRRRGEELLDSKVDGLVDKIYGENKEKLIEAFDDRLNLLSFQSIVLDDISSKLGLNNIDVEEKFLRKFFPLKSEEGKLKAWENNEELLDSFLDFFEEILDNHAKSLQKSSKKELVGREIEKILDEYLLEEVPSASSEKEDLIDKKLFKEINSEALLDLMVCRLYSRIVYPLADNKDGKIFTKVKIENNGEYVDKELFISLCDENLVLGSRVMVPKIFKGLKLQKLNDEEVEEESEWKLLKKGKNRLEYEILVQGDKEVVEVEVTVNDNLESKDEQNLETAKTTLSIKKDKQDEEEEKSYGEKIELNQIKKFLDHYSKICINSYKSMRGEWVDVDGYLASISNPRKRLEEKIRLSKEDVFCSVPELQDNLKYSKIRVKSRITKKLLSIAEYLDENGKFIEGPLKLERKSLCQKCVDCFAKYTREKIIEETKKFLKKEISEESDIKLLTYTKDSQSNEISLKLNFALLSSEAKIKLKANEIIVEKTIKERLKGLILNRFIDHTYLQRKVFLEGLYPGLYEDCKKRSKVHFAFDFFKNNILSDDSRNIQFVERYRSRVLGIIKGLFDSRGGEEIDFKFIVSFVTELNELSLNLANRGLSDYVLKIKFCLQNPTSDVAKEEEEAVKKIRLEISHLSSSEVMEREKEKVADYMVDHHIDRMKVELISKLLKNGFDPNTHNYKNVSREALEDEVKNLKDVEGEDYKINGNGDRFIYEEGSSRKLLKIETKPAGTSVHSAVQNGSYGCLVALLSSGRNGGWKVSLDRLDDKKMTPGNLATFLGKDLEFYRAMKEAGISNEEIDKEKRSNSKFFESAKQIFINSSLEASEKENKRKNEQNSIESKFDSLDKGKQILIERKEV